MRYQKTFVKVLWFNLLTPLVIFLAVAVALAVLNYRRAYQSEQQRLELETEQAVAIVDRVLTQNRQILETASRFGPLREVLPEIDAITEERFNTDPRIRVPVELLAALGEEEGVSLVYAGYRTQTGILPGRWVGLPDGYDARTRPWYTTTAETGAFS